MKLWILVIAVHVCAAQNYYGTHISKLSELHHAVSGDVFAVDSRTLFIKGFTYDGEGPAAYFYVGNSRAPTNQGSFRLRDERGSNGVLKKYRNKDITLTLPEGKTLRDVKWFSVWCDEFAVDFGNVNIAKTLEFPRPKKIGSLKGIHAVQSDNIVIVDAQTLLIPNFSYDGVAPDAKFWVGQGTKPSPNGLRISDENGKESPLRRYDRKTIVLTLPGNLTVFDINYFGVWCEAFTVDFAHVKIPPNANVPPSLKMLGISPQSKLNCEVLHDELAFEVRWAVAGESVVIQLVAKLDDNEYMSFGVSSDKDRSLMIGGDVVVAWVNRLTGKGYSQDYFLEAKSQCSGTRGSCPDTRLKENSNSIRLLNAAIVNDYSIVTYQRPLKAADAFDQSIFVNGSQAILWAVGPLNQRFEVSYHSQFLKQNKKIDFGRQPSWNCPIPEGESKPLFSDLEQDNKSPRPQSQKLNQPNINRNDETSRQTTKRPVPTPKPVQKRDSWDIPDIQCNEPEDGVFYAQIGPTGGKMGYPAITGHVGWGISWYINGLLIPEINVVRNKTYTFVVEGGNDKENSAKYHPFYITDDSVGGFEHKTEEERRKIKIFAGVHQSRNNKITPTGVGRICNWTPDISGPSADEYPSFGAYQRSLTLKCEEGEPGIITWTPDESTPDTVFYQCFTHRYLGWKINVMDECNVDGQAQASEKVEKVFTDINAEPSIKHESKLFPSENFLQQHEKDLIKHHNMNGATPKVTADLQKTGEFDKLINEGILAAEALEEKLLNSNKQNRTKEITILSFEQGQMGGEEKELLDAIAKIPKYEQNQRPVLTKMPPPQFINGRPQSFMRIPQPMNYNFYKPQKHPFRHVMEKRPMSRKPIPPFLLSQQSAMINHYKKPPMYNLPPPMYNLPPPMGVRNNVGKMPLPPKRMRPLLLLGEPTEIKPSFRKTPPKDVIIGNPSKTPIDLPPVHSFKGKKPENPRPMKNNNKLNKSSFPPPSPFKEPFDIKTEAVPMREASNTGFKQDTIVVESGFRPIFRREDIGKRDDSSEDSMEIPLGVAKKGISRRSDDIDDIIYDDRESREELKTVNFEPMFVPSPRDSVFLPLVNDSKSQEDVTMAADASEKQEFFYLPPNDSKRASSSLDMALLNDPLPSKNDFVKLSSKTKQFIADTPQFAPFKGDLPSDLKLQLASAQVAASASKGSVISTKLSAVKQQDNIIKTTDET